MDKPDIKFILGSTRKGRQGDGVAKWIMDLASQRSDFDFELLDLRDWPLPFFDEPKSPSKLTVDEYSNETARKWYRKISEGDGFVMIFPEYNHGYPAVLKNAMDYLNKPWNKKPIACVTYSNGAIAGARAAEQLRLVSLDLEMVPIRSAVHLPNVPKVFEQDEEVERLNKRAESLFNSIVWWAKILKEARNSLNN